MAFDEEKKAALSMLQGIEEGTMTTPEAFALLDEADPTLVYFVFKWLRKRYRDHPEGQAILGRLGDVRASHRSLTRKAKAGEEDPVVGWFEGTYKYEDLDASEFIDLVVEKLEG